jgi:predicted phage terminase large subunit-like protein
MDLLKNRHLYPELLSRINELENPIPALRDLCKADLFFLLVYGLNRKDANKDWLFARCREVQAYPNDHLDLWSREHYKSTIITFALTIQDILNNPDITIGIFSHTRPNAKGFLRQIKREFELNKNLIAWFPDILYENPSKEAIKWSEDDGIIVKRKSNPKEATIEAWGVVDGQPTGKHFSLLVYDDIVTKESVTTPDMIEKTTGALALSYNLGAHGGHKRFIGTRYHFADTYKTVLERGTATPRIHAATHDGSMTGNPVFLTPEQLSIKRRDMGPYVFSCQMLQNPVADSSQGFDRAWVNHYDGELQLEQYNWYILVDAANGKRKNNDYTSMWAVGLGHDGNYYCIPEVRDRLNLTERAARLMALHKKYKPVEVRYERYGMMADINYIMQVQAQEAYRFRIIEVAGATSKIDRIKRLVPLFEDGKVWLPRIKYTTDYEGKARNLIDDFIESELVPFPVPLHDDMLDALARIADIEGTDHSSGEKKELILKWPEAKRKKPRPELPTFTPSIPGFGY